MDLNELHSKTELLHLLLNFPLPSTFCRPGNPRYQFKWSSQIPGIKYTVKAKNYNSKTIFLLKYISKDYQCGSVLPQDIC
jgi:hypothetical protein